MSNKKKILIIQKVHEKGMELINNHPDFDVEVTENTLKENPKLGQYWRVKNGQEFLYALIVDENPIVVQYFEPTVKGQYYSLNQRKFEVFNEDFDVQIDRGVSQGHV